MKAISLKQPWATLIVKGGKDIENRNWKTHQRGVVAIHASAKMSKADIGDACGMMREFIPKFNERIFIYEALHSPEMYPLGAIIGTTEIVDCVTTSNSPWFVGDFGFVLRNQISFANPIPCRGALGFWTVPEGLLSLMRDQYRLAKAKSC